MHTESMAEPVDFYEDDEPAEKVWAAFDQADKQVTTKPSPGVKVDRSAQLTIVDSRLTMPGIPVSSVQVRT